MASAMSGVGSRTEAQNHELSNDLDQLCRDAVIDLPRQNQQSPGKIQHGPKQRLVQHFKLLWWKDKPALYEAINAFFRCLPSTQNGAIEDVKIQLLLEKLKAPAQAAVVQSMTPRASRTLFTVLDDAQPEKQDPPSPSALKSTRITKHFRTAKPSPGRSQNTSHADTYHTAKTSLYVSGAEDTSFATTVAKSFELSFRSSIGSSGSQDTSATSYKSISAPTTPPQQESNSSYISVTDHAESKGSGSLRHGEFTERLRKAAVPPDIAEQAMYPQLPTARRKRDSDATWGSSIGGSAIDEICQKTATEAPSSRRRARDSEPTWGSSMGESVFDEGQQHANQYFDHGHTWEYHHSMTHDADAENSRTKRPKLSDNCDQPEIPSARFQPSSGFAQLQIPAAFSELPFHVQWEVERLLQNQIVSPHRLISSWQPQTLSTLYEIASQQEKPFERHSDFEGCTLTAKLQFARSGNGTLFDMKLKSKSSSKEKTSDLQRRFGCDRILYVDMESLNKPPDFLKGRNLLGRFQEMAKSPQTFLGRRWFLLLAQAHKSKRSNDSNALPPGACRLTFVAIDKHMPLTDVVSYVVPYHENASQMARKLYSRFELVVSASTPAITFASSDIEYGIQDQLATSDSDSLAFLDPALLEDLDAEPLTSVKEMSDGCCEMSFYTACKVKEALHLTTIPSAIQCRIAGSKGVWYRAKDSNYVDRGSKPPGTHIKIANTQIKVKRQSLSSSHPGTLTLNVIKANSTPKASVLHIGFLPILLDRGVSKNAVFEVIEANVKSDLEDLVSALQSHESMPLRRWMASRNELPKEYATQADWPKLRFAKVVQMLEAGFVPTQDAFLANEVCKVIEQTTDITRKNFRIPLARSTTLLGIADPVGCLEPGEIHVHFSDSFRDSVTGVSWPALNAMEGLVARNPAMARWDVQRVRFVFRPELAHLPDMAIFPTKGKRPLAELLQGGDYDGDTFWLCWEPRLVENFKNAPAPWKPPPIDFFGIKKDPRKLQDLVKDPTSESEWCDFFSKMAATRVRFNPLGVVTRLHERLVYLQRGISSKEAQYLVHLHDYLVDADKQGFDFDHDDLTTFKRKIQLPRDLPIPRYWKFTKVDDEDDGYPTQLSVGRNIIDQVFLEVVEPMIKRTVDQARQILSVATESDPHLCTFYDETWESAGKDSLIRREIQLLKEKLTPIRERWTTQKNRQKDWKYDDFVTRLRAQYDSIIPRDDRHPTVVEWTRRQGNDLSLWERLKASTLARFHYKAFTPGTFVFALAGRELCVLKQHEVGRSRPITVEAWCNMKINKRAKVIQEQADELETEDDGNDDADEYY